MIFSVSRKVNDESLRVFMDTYFFHLFLCLVRFKQKSIYTLNSLPVTLVEVKFFDKGEGVSCPDRRCQRCTR